MTFEVYRNCDVNSLLKVRVVLLDEEGEIVDKRKMMAFPLITLAWRLKLVKKRMLKFAAIVKSKS